MKGLHSAVHFSDTILRRCCSIPKYNSGYHSTRCTVLDNIFVSLPFPSCLQIPLLIRDRVKTKARSPCLQTNRGHLAEYSAFMLILKFSYMIHFPQIKKLINKNKCTKKKILCAFWARYWNTLHLLFDIRMTLHFFTACSFSTLPSWGLCTLDKSM